MKARSKPDYDRANDEARKLLKRAKVTAAPVPVLSLARTTLGAVVRTEAFPGDVSGMLYCPADAAPIIGVNALDLPVRQRFTVAHELGHLVLHANLREFSGIHVDKTYRRDGRSKTADDPREVEANGFAAELLVPLEFLREDIGVHGIDVESDDEVATLAKRYEVSVQMMTIRLSKLIG